MPKAPPADRKEITADLANARQTLTLLKSQIKSGKLNQSYWEPRLKDILDLLDAVSRERTRYGRQQRLAAMYEVSKTFGSSLDLDEVLNQAMDAIIRLTNAERGFVMLFDEKGDLEVKVARNMVKETLEEEEFAISRSVINLVAKTGKQVLTTNASDDPRFSAQSSVIAHKLRSIQCVPLRGRGDILGVVYVDNRIKAGAFDEADLDMLMTFAGQASLAIENARLFTLTDKALAQRVEELSMLQEIDRQLNETLDFSTVMSATLAWAVRVTQADNGAIGIIELEMGKTRVVAQHGEAPADVRAILLEGQQVVNSDGTLTVPIQREGRVIGVIALDRRDQKPFSLEAQSFVLRLADHAAISIENAQLYEAVKKANEVKNEFVSVMTHELRVPMTSIKGYAEMLPMVGPLNEQQKNFLEIVHSNVIRMSNLVSDLSDISRIESGRLKIEIAEKVNMAQAIDEVLTAVRGEIDKRGHQLKTEIPADLPTVRVDPQRLNQIITNLVSNAYKYTPDGGMITVRVKASRSFVRCEIIDTGVGMSKEEMDKLFTKFWRSEDRHVREQTGTGLGLTIAKSLVEMQGGEMTATSEKGKGTTFTFTLPVSRELP
jgi:signal transduction histidine kinase